MAECTKSQITFMDIADVLSSELVRLSALSKLAVGKMQDEEKNEIKKREE